MPDHPADIRGRPIDLARIDAIDVLHRPFQRHQMPAGRPDNAFRHPGGTRGIKDIDRIVGVDLDTVGRRAIAVRRRPFHVPTVDQRRLKHRALHDNAGVRLMRRSLNRPIQQRLIVDHPARLDATGSRDHQLWRRVLDPLCQLIGGETAENHRMHRPDPRAGQHRHHGFGDHRHIDNHPVAIADAVFQQHTGKGRDLIAQRRIADRGDGIADRAVIDHRRLRAPTFVDMTVDGVVAGIDLAADEPTGERLIVIVEHPVPALLPDDILRRLGPKPLGVLQRPPVGIGIKTHRILPRNAAPASPYQVNSPSKFSGRRSGTAFSRLCGKTPRGASRGAGYRRFEGPGVSKFWAFRGSGRLPAR